MSTASQLPLPHTAPEVSVRLIWDLSGNSSEIWSFGVKASTKRHKIQSSELLCRKFRKRQANSLMMVAWKYYRLLVYQNPFIALISIGMVSSASWEFLQHGHSSPFELGFAACKKCLSILSNFHRNYMEFGKLSWPTSILGRCLQLLEVHLSHPRSSIIHDHEHYKCQKFGLLYYYLSFIIPFRQIWNCSRYYMAMAN